MYDGRGPNRATKTTATYGTPPAMPKGRNQSTKKTMADSNTIEIRVRLDLLTVILSDETNQSL